MSRPATTVRLSSGIKAALSRFVRGRDEDPTWERPALLFVLFTNGVLYCWNLGINGWANYYYSAAVQAGTFDNEAFFYGSSDWGNSITVDKPPLSLWLMGVSARLLGFQPIALLLPQAILGVATAFLIYKILRRCTSGIPALFGAVVFFTTPIITLMSRYNNPDPLMLFLMVWAVWYVAKSVETGSARYFVLAGALLGLAFMTKQLQGLLSVPAIGISFLLFSPQPWRRKLVAAGAGVLVLVTVGAIWPLTVDLTPSKERPFVGGSSSNSVLQLTLAYNGIDRVAGTEVNPMTALIPAQFRSVDSDAGVFRLLNANFGQEASWLLYASLIAAALLVATTWSRTASRQDKALTLLSALWLVSTFLLLSFMGKQIHTYYTAALAPPMALTLGLAADLLIRRRDSVYARSAGAIVCLTALTTSWLVLSGTIGWPTWLPVAILVTGIVAISALLIRAPRVTVEKFAAAVLALALLAGPTMTSVLNVTIPSTGSNPVSGRLTKNPAGISHLLHAMQNNDPAWAHDTAYGRSPDQRLVETLANAHVCTWAAATYAGQSAARLQIESGRPIMPIGGFAGSDAFPAPEDFKAKVAAGEICYFVAQEASLEVQPPDSATVSITKWVVDNYRAQTIGNTTVYSLIGHG